METVSAVVEDDLGGGICQVATTLFNAAFFAGLDIVERVPLEVHPNEENERYLRTKRDKLGHIILQKRKEGD